MPDALVLEQVGEVASTSETLKARAGAPGEMALLARRQTGGRGRMGRPWHTIDGNLHLSVLLRPGSLPYPGHWSILAAVALADVAGEYLPNPTLMRLKWPNDVLVADGKLAGILLEAGMTAPPWLVIGFGVNLAGAPEGLGRKLAALADWCTPPPPPEAFARQLLIRLQEWRARYHAQGFEPVRAAWLEVAHRRGDHLVVAMGERRVEGAFRGLAPDGRLLLDTATGPLAIAAGELA